MTMLCTAVVMLGSLALTTAVVAHAYYLKHQFYPTVVYLTKSSPSMAVSTAQQPPPSSLFGFSFLGQEATRGFPNCSSIWFSWERRPALLFFPLPPPAVFPNSLVTLNEQLTTPLSAASHHAGLHFCFLTPKKPHFAPKSGHEGTDLPHREPQNEAGGSRPPPAPDSGSLRVSPCRFCTSRPSCWCSCWGNSWARCSLGSCVRLRWR